MIVVYSGERQRFETICSFLERDLPKAARWRWDAGVKRWYAPSEDVARRLANFATGPAKLRLSGLLPQEAAALAASTASDSNIEVPAPPGLSYLPYQRAGIAYALDRTHTLIADEMGLGKTIQAIGVINDLVSKHGPGSAVLGHHHNGAASSRCRGDVNLSSRRVLVVCPASLRLNWRAEWRRWHTGRLQPALLDHWPRGLLDPTDGRALIVSYDSVQKWHPMIAATDWDVMILDEMHLLKDEGSRRTKSILGGKYGDKTFAPIKAKRILGLTGTAIVNRATDLWPIVKLLAPDGLGSSRADFLERYSGNDRLDELHMRLRTQIMVRRRKDDVLKDLPKKRRQVVLLDIAGPDRIIAREQQAIDLQQAMLERTRQEIADLPHAEQVMRLRQCRAIALSEIAKVRHETARAKLPAAVEHINDVLGNVGKLCIFHHHKDVGHRLQREFHRIAVVLNGDTEPEERQRAVEAFQTDKRVRLFIGSIRAAGMGITLTAASTVIFVELDWTPAMMMQSEDRTHRIGQVNPVLVQHLVIDGSIDAKMSKILVDKQAIMDAALDGGTDAGGSRDILSEVLSA